MTQRLIDVTRFLSIGGKPFREQRETKYGVYKGLFWG
jgi:hypothetical protein